MSNNKRGGQRRDQNNRYDDRMGRPPYDGERRPDGRGGRPPYDGRGARPPYGGGRPPYNGKGARPPYGGQRPPYSGKAGRPPYGRPYDNRRGEAPYGAARPRQRTPYNGGRPHDSRYMGRPYDNGRNSDSGPSVYADSDRIIYEPSNRYAPADPIRSERERDPAQGYIPEPLIYDDFTVDVGDLSSDEHNTYVAAQAVRSDDTQSIEPNDDPLDEFFEDDFDEPANTELFDDGFEDDEDIARAVEEEFAQYTSYAEADEHDGSFDDDYYDQSYSGDSFDDSDSYSAKTPYSRGDAFGNERHGSSYDLSYEEQYEYAEESRPQTPSLKKRIAAFMDELPPAPEHRPYREVRMERRREYDSSRPVNISFFAIIVLAVMALISSYLISSGEALVSDNIKMGLSASNDIYMGLDTLGQNVRSNVFGTDRVYALSLTETPSEPDPDGFSSYTDESGIKHRTYTDPTIFVDCYKMFVETKDSSSVVNVAHVKIEHPTQLRTAFAGGSHSASRRSYPTEIAARNNAVIGINADMYNSFDRGVLVRQGSFYGYTAVHLYMDILFIDDKGDLIIVPGKEAFEFYNSGEHNIYNSFSFGPGIIKDGKLVDTEHYYMTCNFYKNPLAAIGQIGELEYVLVTAEGRTSRSSGMVLNDLANVMLELGCVTAYNLDGGQSANMVFNNDLFSTPANGNQRPVSELLFFASAMPEDAAAEVSE